MVKACFILSSYNWGGVTKFVEELCMSLIDLGVESLIVAREVIKPPPNLISSHIVELKSPSNWSYCKRLETVIKKEQCEVVNTHDVYSLLGLKNIKNYAHSCFTYHGIIPFKYTRPADYYGSFLGYLSLLWAAKNVEVAIGISNYIVNELRKWGFTRYKYIPVGISVKKFRNGRPLKSIKEDNYPILLDVGQIDKSQGTHILINSMPHIIRIFPNAKLLLVGEIVDWNLYYKVMRNDLLRKHVAFTGFVPESLLINLYHTSDIVIEVPYWHGFGLPILEGMACGKPVITRSAYAMKEHIENSKGGALIRQDNPHEIVDAIIKITNNYDYYAKNALNYAKAFDIKLIAEKYRKLFHELIKG
uniref:Glycosyltransferase n=1 Tax=Ignisphaera aggregans TaxID=334771 RepID=A0A7J3YTY7_9CREN